MLYMFQKKFYSKRQDRFANIVTEEIKSIPFGNISLERIRVNTLPEIHPYYEYPQTE